MNYDVVVENLMRQYAEGTFATEVTEAKKEFFDRAGILDEFASDFELKMAQFVDWYLFTRRLKSTGQTPVAMAVDSQFIESVEGLTQSIHSLFEFIKLKGSDVHIRDVITGEKYVIKDSPVTIGFDKNELFEARLIPLEGTYCFSKAFCFHPPQVTKIILKEVKKLKKAAKEEFEELKEQLLVRLFKLRYKHEQYKHLDAREIYSPDSKLKI